MSSIFEISEFVTGRIRPVMMPVGHLSETVCIAIIGWSSSKGAISHVVTEKALSCLPADFGLAIYNFASIAVSDYSEWCLAGRPWDKWSAPISGLRLGDCLDIEAFDENDLLRVGLSMAALWPGDRAQDEGGRANRLPRTSEQSRFLQAIKVEIEKVHPDLLTGFQRPLSMVGKVAAGEIDYVGNHYVTCYAAINPKSRGALRVQTASAALWRLARVRDTFGFAAPAVIELTAWVPQPGLPIYSDADYSLVYEMVAELSAQAGKEGLTIHSTPDAVSASRRLIDREIVNSPSYS